MEKITGLYAGLYAGLFSCQASERLSLNLMSSYLMRIGHPYWDYVLLSDNFI